jgi:hypothetical protein
MTPVVWEVVRDKNGVLVLSSITGRDRKRIFVEVNGAR